jgi:hypothetical protein
MARRHARRVLTPGKQLATGNDKRSPKVNTTTPVVRLPARGKGHARVGSSGAEITREPTVFADNLLAPQGILD